jgi:hypothetical protein
VNQRTELNRKAFIAPGAGSEPGKSPTPRKDAKKMFKRCMGEEVDFGNR